MCGRYFNHAQRTQRVVLRCHITTPKPMESAKGDRGGVITIGDRDTRRKRIWVCQQADIPEIPVRQVITES